MKLANGGPVSAPKDDGTPLVHWDSGYVLSRAEVEALGGKAALDNLRRINAGHGGKGSKSP